jgi:hypothetical protein
MVYKSLFESVDPKMTSVELLPFNLYRSNVKNESTGYVNYTSGQDSIILFHGNDYVLSRFQTGYPRSINRDYFQ